jgi:hypothetical protein
MSKIRISNGKKWQYIEDATWLARVRRRNLITRRRAVHTACVPWLRRIMLQQISSELIQIGWWLRKRSLAVPIGRNMYPSTKNTDLVDLDWQNWVLPTTDWAVHGLVTTTLNYFFRPRRGTLSIFEHMSKHMIKHGVTACSCLMQNTTLTQSAACGFKTHLVCKSNVCLIQISRVNRVHVMLSSGLSIQIVCSRGIHVTLVLGHGPHLDHGPQLVWTRWREMTSWFGRTYPQSDDVFVIVIVFVLVRNIPNVHSRNTIKLEPHTMNI